MRGALFWLATVQSAYFVLTGVWPLVHMRSFLAVTGPKHDLWLVKTVGVLVTVVGLAIGMAAYRRNVSPEIMLLAAGSAAALGVVDLVYVLRRVISKIYLLDAVAEMILVVAWLLSSRPPVPRWEPERPPAPISKAVALGATAAAAGPRGTVEWAPRARRDRLCRSSAPRSNRVASTPADSIGRGDRSCCC